LNMMGNTYNAVKIQMRMLGRCAQELREVGASLARHLHVLRREFID